MGRFLILLMYFLREISSIFDYVPPKQVQRRIEMRVD